jgi:hypothetical protein
MGGAEVAGAGADCIEVLRIGQAVADAGAAGPRGDAAPGPPSPAVVTGQEVDRRAPAGQRDGGRVPDPGGRAGNEDGPPVEAGVVIGGVLGQQPGPDGQAEPEAAASAGRAGIQLLPGEHSGSHSAASLKVARYPDVSVAECRDSTVAW